MAVKIAVTGAAGFIGSHLVPALLKRGWSVTALVEPGLGEKVEGADVVEADIVSGEGLGPAFRSAEAVVHLAARGHVLKERAKDPLKEYRRVNVEGTRNVLRCGLEAGAKLFIPLSSVKAMGEEGEGVLDEGSACSPSTPYGISKWESEEAVRKEVMGSGMHATILRLPMVYGPGNKGNFPRMIHWADRGLPFPVVQPDNLRSMVYVGNVVAGILTILGKAGSGVSTYILKDREDYTVRAVYSAVCKSLGKKPRFWGIPGWAVRLGGTFYGDLRKVTGSLRFSSAKIEKELGFAPQFFLEEGVGRTVEWYKASRKQALGQTL